MDFSVTTGDYRSGSKFNYGRAKLANLISADKIFSGIYFGDFEPPAKSAKICTPRKIPAIRYSKNELPPESLCTCIL